MTSLSATQQTQAASSYSYYSEMRLSLNAVVIQSSLGTSDSEDSNEASINDLFKGLSITAKNIVDKINELLKAKMPNGVQSLKPQEVTPEATADRIVKGVTALYDAYAEQHPELEGEDLLNAFMEEVRSGVDEGYNDAFETLDGLGAFEFDGVKDGVQKTKELIETKLKAFEEAKRKELGLESEDTASLVSSDVTSELLAQVGKQVSVYA